MSIIDVRVQVGTTPIWGTPFTDSYVARMMSRYGIERCVASDTLANTCDFVRGNAEMRKVAGQNGIFGCMVVNTHYPSQSLEEIKLCLGSSNFAALLITSGPEQHVVSLDQCDEILNANRRYAKPVFLNVRNREAVLAADEMAKAFPGA